MKVWIGTVPGGAISVSMAITGVPASIIFLIGSVSVPMPKVWIATKSHFCEAMLSMAARCLVAESSPSNQVISTFMSLPQASAACLPWAHHVACRPAFEKAAFIGLPAGASACAMAGSKPASASSAAPSAVAPSFLNTSRRVAASLIRSSSIALVLLQADVISSVRGAVSCRYSAETSGRTPMGETSNRACGFVQSYCLTIAHLLQSIMSYCDCENATCAARRPLHLPGVSVLIAEAATTRLHDMPAMIETREGYAPQKPETLAAYLSSIDAAFAQFLAAIPALWTIAEVGDGNLNLVFIVKGPRGRRRREAGTALCAARGRRLAAAAVARALRAHGAVRTGAADGPAGAGDPSL